MPKFDPNKHHRKSMRLKGCDYTSPGAYYITICTFQMVHLFGEIYDCQMHLNKTGMTVKICWEGIETHFPNAKLDEFVIMPNHIHGIIMIPESDDRRGMACHAQFDIPMIAEKGMACHAPTNRLDSINQDIGESPKFGKSIAGSISTMVGSFKAAATRLINEMNDSQGSSLWQRDFYDHIIRNEDELHRIREYILYNPAKWIDDEYYS